MMWAFIILGGIVFISLITNIIRGNDDPGYHRRHRHPRYDDSFDGYGFGRIHDPYRHYPEGSIFSPDHYRYYQWDPYTQRWVRHSRSPGGFGTIIFLILVIILIYYLMRD